MYMVNLKSVTITPIAIPKMYTWLTLLDLLYQSLMS